MRSSVSPDVIALPLAGRLMLLADKMGGKRALAEAAGVSESQIFRYLNGDSEMSAAKAVALARATGVDVGWLLTGEGVPEPVRRVGPSFRAALMEDILRVLTEVLVDFEWRLNPTQRARYAAYAYMALRLEEDALGHDVDVTPERLMEGLWYFGKTTFDELLGIHRDAIMTLAYEKTAVDDYWASGFANAVSAGYENFHNSQAGAALFRRIGQKPAPLTCQLLLRILSFWHEANPNRKRCAWLDVGCGNGRDMLFIRQTDETIDLHGIDVASYPIRLARQLLAPHAISHDALCTGDLRHLPHAPESFDIVYSRMSLYGIPDFGEKSQEGLQSALLHAVRVLKPGGLLALIHPEGQHPLWLYPTYFNTAENITSRLARLGMSLISSDILDLGVGDPNLRHQSFILMRKDTAKA